MFFSSGSRHFLFFLHVEPKLDFYGVFFFLVFESVSHISCERRLSSYHYWSLI